MIDFFTIPTEVNAPIVKPPEWTFIQRGMINNIQEVLTFYNTYNKAVKSNHFLVRLLDTLPISKTLELERYYSNVDTIALNLSMHLKMTSSIYKGYLFKGIFYGKNNTEILIATDDYFDFEYVDKNWKTVTAVTPLLHPKSDMGLHVPDGNDYSSEEGLAVILINIPMLAVQYRAFWRDQRLNNIDDNVKSIMQFVGGYVLPNMIPKQTEICLFNRIYNRFYNKNQEKVFMFRKHTFGLANYTNQTDVAINKMIINATNSNGKFDTVLKSLCSFTKNNMYEVLQIPTMLATMQIDWALVLTRLKATNFLLDVCRENLNSRNQPILNQMLRSLRRNNVLNILENTLPDDVYFEIDSYIENIMESAIGRDHF